MGKKKRTTPSAESKRRLTHIVVERLKHRSGLSDKERLALLRTEYNQLLHAYGDLVGHQFDMSEEFRNALKELALIPKVFDALVRQGKLDNQAANRIRTAIGVAEWKGISAINRYVGKNFPQMVEHRLKELGLQADDVSHKMRRKLAREFHTTDGSITDALSKIKK
jgi:hypothetical protein